MRVFFTDSQISIYSQKNQAKLYANKRTYGRYMDKDDSAYGRYMEKG